MRSFVLKSLVIGFLGFGVSAPARAALEFGVDPSNPLSSSLYVDLNSGTQNVPISVYDITNPDSSPDTIDSITVDPIVNVANGAFSPATTMNLVANGTIYASQGIGSGPVTFDHIQSLVVPSGTTIPLAVEVNIPPPSVSINQGVGTTTLLTKLAGVTYADASGSHYGAAPNVVANPQYFFAAVPELGFVGGSASGMTNKNGQTTFISGTLTLTVTPQGGPMFQPIVGGSFQIGVGTSLAQAESNILPTADIVVTSIVPSPASIDSLLPEGQTDTIELSMIANSVLLPYSGNYQFYLLGATTSVYSPGGSLVDTDQTWGLDNFTSGPVIVSVLPEPASASILSIGALILCRRQRRNA